MESVNGGVECALPHTTVSSEMRPAFSSWQGAINGGGAPVNVRTVNGRLRVASALGDTPAAPAASSAQTARPAERSSDAASAAPAASFGSAAAPAASSAEPARPAERSTMDILRAVERGELTVDDAMKAMSAKPNSGDAPGEPFSS